MLKSFLAGSLSGTCSTLLFQPFDLVKTRIQNANFAFSPAGASTTVAAPNRITGVLVDIVKNEQFMGLWRGTVPVSFELIFSFKLLEQCLIILCPTVSYSLCTWCRSALLLFGHAAGTLLLGTSAKGS